MEERRRRWRRGRRIPWNVTSAKDQSSRESGENIVETEGVGS